MYFCLRSTRSGLSIELSDYNAGGSQEVIANCEAFFQNRDNHAVLRGVGDGCHRNRFVARGIERLAERLDARRAKCLQLGKKLVPDELDASQYGCQPSAGVGLEPRVARLASGPPGRGTRPIEVVSDIEQLRKNCALAAIHFPRDIAPHPYSRLLEFLERPPMFGHERLKLRRLIGELPFKLLDVGRLA